MDNRFDDLWLSFQSDLLAYIKSKVSSTYDAEDILQDVSIKLYKHIDSVDEKTSLKAWLYKITKNTIIDFYRKKKDVSVEPESLYTIEDDVEEDNMNIEISKCMKYMLFDLPEKYFHVYDMYENKDMKHKDIGVALNITQAASKVRLKRARDMFKEKLLSCCDFDVDVYGNILDYRTKEPCVSCGL